MPDTTTICPGIHIVVLTAADAMLDTRDTTAVEAVQAVILHLERQGYIGLTASEALH